MAFSEESGPGLGFWIAMASGLGAGIFAVYLGTGAIGFFVGFVVVGLAMGLLLS